jgi:hypothetical protein
LKQRYNKDFENLRDKTRTYATGTSDGVATPRHAKRRKTLAIYALARLDISIVGLDNLIAKNALFDILIYSLIRFIG